MNCNLFTTHFFQTFGDRLWEFAIPILFIELWNDSLFPVAFCNFIKTLTIFLIMPHIGNWIDTTNRWKVMKHALIA